jgi:hypothetical protein
MNKKTLKSGRNLEVRAGYPVGAYVSGVSIGGLAIRPGENGTALLFTSASAPASASLRVATAFGLQSPSRAGSTGDHLEP